MTNKSDYKAFCNQHNLPIFYQPWWLDVVSKDWDVVVYKKSNQIFGVFPYEMKKKWGLTYLLPPILTPQLGPWLAYPDGQKNNTKLGYEKEIYSYLIDNLPKNQLSIVKLSPSLSNTQPFQWKKYESSVKYTFILDSIKGKSDEVYNRLSSSTRKNINKATKLINVDASNDIDVLIDLSNQTFSRQGLENPYSANMIKTLFEEIQKKKLGKLLIARDNQGNAHAAMLLIWDNQSAYYLIGGADTRFRNSEAMSLLMWKSIELASDKVDLFDFEGTMVESVERFFRGFGGVQTPYYQLVKATPKWLKSIFKLRLDIS